MMRLLISVRSLDEAQLALRGGAHFIDLKEPARGALGALPLASVRAIVRSLRAQGAAQTISATIGEPTQVLPAVHALADCGIDIVKVGIARCAASHLLLDALARCDTAVLPVFIADDGLDDSLIARALAARCFAGVMLDTADKGAGSLLARLPQAVLERFVAHARAADTMVGLAGALRIADVPALERLGCDFAGFRSAVCAGTRAGTLDLQRLEALRRSMQGATLQAS